jgi:hypothetical protein
MIDRDALHRQLVHRVYRIDSWAADHSETWPRPLRAAYDRFDEHRVLQALCAVLGHEPEPDQCLMPEHDQCGLCQSLLPFQAGNVPARLLRRLHYRLDDPELSAKITAKLGDDGLDRKPRRSHG